VQGGLWEAHSESTLMSISEPRLAYISIQPDNSVYASGWNLELIKPIQEFSDVFAVSAYMGHAFGDAAVMPSIGRGRRQELPIAFGRACSRQSDESGRGRVGSNASISTQEAAHLARFASREKCLSLCGFWGDELRAVSLYNPRACRGRLDSHQVFFMGDWPKHFNEGIPIARNGVNPVEHELASRTFFVHDTVSRGPLAFHAQRMRELHFFDYGLYPFENSDHEVSCRASRRGWTVGFFFINATIRCYREGCRRSPRHGDKTYGLLPQTLLLRQSAHMEKAKAKQEGVPHRGGCLLSNKRSLIEQLPRFERRLVATARHWADVMPHTAAGG